MPFRTEEDVLVAEPQTFRQPGDELIEPTPAPDPYDGLTADEVGARRTEVIDLAAEIGIGADAVELDIDRARQRIASITEPLAPPKGVQPGSGQFTWNFRAVRPDFIAKLNERDEAVIEGLREYLGPESERGPADIERAEYFFRRGRVPLPHEKAEVSADMRAKFAALSDDDLKLVSNALLVQHLEVSDSVHEALAQERKVRPVIEYIKSLPEPVQVAIQGISTSTAVFGVRDFLSKGIGLERLWRQTEGDVSIVFEAARRVQAEKNREDALNLARAVGGVGEIARVITEFAAVPDVTSKIAAFGKLGTIAQRLISTSVRFGLREALQLPREGETLAERAEAIGISAATGVVLGAVGGKITSPFLRAGRVVGTTGGFMGLTAARGGDIEAIIETGVMVLGFQAFGAIRRGATGLRVRMERAKVARAIKAVRNHNPDLRGVPDEAIGVLLDGYQQISWWQNQFKRGKVTEDVAVGRVNDILDRMGPVMRAVHRSVRTAAAQGPQTTEQALTQITGVKPAAPKAEGAKPPVPAARPKDVARAKVRDDIAARQDAQARAVEEIDELAGQHLRSISGREPGDLAPRGVLPELAPQGPGGQTLPTTTPIEAITPAEAPRSTKEGRIEAQAEAEWKVIKEYLAKHDASKGRVPAKEPYLPSRDEAFAEKISAGEHLKTKPSAIYPDNLEHASDAIKIGEQLGYRPEDIAAYLKRNYVDAAWREMEPYFQPTAPKAEMAPEIEPVDREQLDAIVDEVRANEGEKAARIVQELQDAGIKTIETNVTDDDIVVTIGDLSPENRAGLEAAGNITVEDSKIGTLIRVAQPADPVLRTGEEAVRPEAKPAVPAAPAPAVALETRETRVAKLAAEIADLEAFDKEIKAKDGTGDEFPADFKAKITKSLAAKKTELTKAEAGEEARRVELVKQIESMVVQKGLTKKRTTEIMREEGGQSKPVMKFTRFAKTEAGTIEPVTTRREMTVEQLEAVIDAVRQERPKRVGHKTVITPKTETKIQTLFQRMMKNREMTADHYDAILTDIIGSERVGDMVRTREPRFISGVQFITENQGKEIIQAMLDSAEVIRETESLASAIRGRPDIEPIVKRLEERIAAKRKRDPHSLMSMRRFNQQFEITAQTPVYTMYEKLVRTNQLLARERQLVRQSLKDAVDDFGKIARDEKALQRVSDYIAAKSYLEDRPKSPEDITPDEVKLANRIEKVLESYEIKARVGKFVTWIRANKPLSGRDAMPQYDRFEAEIIKAVDIYEGQGFEELWRYLSTQQWGVIKSGYEPLQVLSTKLRLHKMPETAVARSHVRPREDIKYHKQEKNILQRLDSYMKQMDTLADLHPIIKGYARLINEKLDDFKEPQNISKDVEHFLNNLKRFNIQGGFFERLSSRLYAQAVKAVILDNPVLAFRNRFQPWSFEADKSILFDPRNKKLSPEDIEFVETHVLQARNMMIEYFLTREKPLPGLKNLSKFVDWTTLYPGSDTANRWQTFTGKINQVWRALDKSESVEEMMVRAKFMDMTELEQRLALGILARDGEDAMARFVAKQHTDEVHFRYERAERAPAEMSPVGRVIGNLITFSRSYWEHTVIAAGKIFDSSAGFKARVRAMKVFLALTVGAWFAGRVYMGVTGRKRNPYSPFRLFGFRPGGLAVGVLETAGDVYNDMLDAASGDERAINALPTSITRAADMFIPYYDMVVSGIEAQVGLKNIDRAALQEIRALIDSEYERRGGVDKVYRTALEKWQRTLAGAGVDITLEELGRQKKIITAIEPGDFEGRGRLGGPGKAERAFIKKTDKFYPELAELRKDANLGKLETAGFFRKIQLEGIASDLNKIADGLEKAKSAEARRKLFDLAANLIRGTDPVPGKE